MLHRKWYFSLKMRLLWYFYDTLCYISREVSLLITGIISISYNDIEYQKWYFDTFLSKNKLTCMNHINLANHLQNLIYYKDEYRLFYPRTPADIRHNITEYYTKWKTYLSESLLYPMSSDHSKSKLLFRIPFPNQKYSISMHIQTKIYVRRDIRAIDMDLIFTH